MKKNRAFTLIELLVVISIIALLMAILMPALGKVRKIAQRTVGLTNQRSIGIALNLYVVDNDNRFSHGKAGSVESKAADVSWIRDVAAYTDKTSSIFVCPSAKKPSQNTALNQGYGTADESWRWDWGANNSQAQKELREEIGLTIGHPISYSYNEWAINPNPDSQAAQRGYFGQARWKTSYCWNSPSQIKDNANTPIIADGRWMYAFVDDQDVPQPAEDSDWLFNQDKWGLNMFMIDRHQGPSVNMLFADNSARNIQLKDVFKLKWHKQYDVNNTYVTDPDRLPEWIK
jgi:prepilin-type N-terminal cleavage/methylation domain-containing protein/prepilin-type processing-associated H-X9-DG protein